MQPDLGCGFGLFFWPPPLGYKLPECMQGFLFFFFNSLLLTEVQLTYRKVYLLKVHNSLGFRCLQGGRTTITSI